MTEGSPISEDFLYPEELVEELDNLTYKRFRSESNESQTLTPEEAERIHNVVSELWKCPKAFPGHVVANAKLESIVGKGAFGTVWKARDLTTGELRAVKVFDPDRMGDGLAVHLFRRGVRAMLYLRTQRKKESAFQKRESPSRFIVGIDEVEPHMLAFSMDWVPDKDLSQGGVRGKTLEQKLVMFRHIAQAVHYAHTLPETIVHRDLKPQNIVMDGNLPILTDFDIADMSFAKTLSRRAVGGAFAYAAPEQLSGECDHLEPRSDVYSLGRLLHFFLLEKDPPLLIEQNPPLDDLNEFPEGLVKIIRRCTSRDLPSRYANVSELLKELSNYANAGDVGVYGPNVWMARKHWSEAESHANQGKWEDALAKGEQALHYIKEKEQGLAEQWTYTMLKWQVRAGNIGQVPTLSRSWYKRLTPTLKLGITLLLLGPILLPITWYAWQQIWQSQLEANLTTLLDAKSLEDEKVSRMLAYLRDNPIRLQRIRSRLAVMLSRANSKNSCRLLELTYRFAPLSPSRFGATNKDTIHLRHIHALIRPLSQQYGWGPIECNKSKFLAMSLSSTNPKHRNLQLWKLKATNSNLMWFYADGIALQADFTNSTVRYSSLREVKLIKSVFSGADFVASDFRNARLDYMKAIGTDFRLTDFRGANFSNSVNSFADFREARFDKAKLIYMVLKGAIFSSNAISALRGGILADKTHHKPICLSSSHFFMRSPASACYAWHKQRELGNNRSPISMLPRYCPSHLKDSEFFISFPQGQLKQEGQCPWDQSLSEPTSKKSSTSRSASRPSTQPNH